MWLLLNGFNNLFLLLHMHQPNKCCPNKMQIEDCKEKGQ